MRPKLLDFCCAAGGCSMGYHMAGFDVTGVDIKLFHRYPFDQIVFDITKLTIAQCRKIRRRYVAVSASPPCKAHTVLSRLRPDVSHPDLVGSTREVLEEIGLPYVIENVPGAPLRDPVQLCGSAFGLRVRRHRLFETNWTATGISCNHEWQDIHRPYHMHNTRDGEWMTGVVPVWGDSARPTRLPYTSTKDIEEITLRRVAMGIDWMSRMELSQAIPPAYTFYIGRQLQEVLR